MQNHPNSFYDAIELEQKQRRIRQGTDNVWPAREQSAIQKASADLDNPKVQIEKAVYGYFTALADKAPALIRLIAVPRALALHPVLSTNVAMNLILNPLPHQSEEVDCVLEEIAPLQERIPTLPEVSALLMNNYVEKERTLAECFWLLKLCQWLNCALPTFSKEMEKKLFVPAHYEPSRPEPELRLRNISYQEAPTSPFRLRPQFLNLPTHRSFDFNEVITDRKIINSELIEESTEQYRVLEQVLRRL